MPRNLTEDYRAALDELFALKEVLFPEEWAAFITERYKKNYAENNKFVQGIVRQAGLPLQGDPTLSTVAYWDPPPNMLSGADMLEFDAYFSASHKVGTLRLSGNKKDLVEQLKRLVAVRNPHTPVVSAIFLSGYGEIAGFPNGAQMTDWRNPSPTSTALLSVDIIDQPQPVPNQPINILVSYQIVEERGHFATEWLKGNTFGKKLVDTREGVLGSGVQNDARSSNSVLAGRIGI
jgi:hypothetical protein